MFPVQLSDESDLPPEVTRDFGLSSTQQGGVFEHPEYLGEPPS